MPVDTALKRGTTPAPSRRDRDPGRARKATWLQPVAALVLVTLLAEAAIRIFTISPLLLPLPSTVGQRLLENWQLLLQHSVPTLIASLAGLTAGLVAALILAFLISELRFVRQVALPLLIALQVTPMIVIAPVLLAWLGFGLSSKIVIAAAICFFPLVVNASLGLSSVPPTMLELAKTVNSGRLTIFRFIRIPHAQPYIFTALRPAAAMAMTGAVIGEFLGGTEGLGYLIVSQMRFLNMAGMFSSVIVLVGWGLLVNAGVQLLGRVMLKWHTRSLQLEE